jgi:hypothetical protein
MYWLLWASTVWKTGLASAKRVKLTDPPVAPDGAALLAATDGAALLGAALLGAAVGAVVGALVGAVVGAAVGAVVGAAVMTAVVGAAVGAVVAAGVDEHAPSTSARMANRLGSFLRIPTLLRLAAG